jgi:hypothetical protein
MLRNGSTLPRVGATRKKKNSNIHRPQWPRGLRHELSSLARKLGSWVRIPLKARMSACVYTVCVVLYSSGVGAGLIHSPRSPTDCLRIKKLTWNKASNRKKESDRDRNREREIVTFIQEKTSNNLKRWQKHPITWVHQHNIMIYDIVHPVIID